MSGYLIVSVLSLLVVVILGKSSLPASPSFLQTHSSAHVPAETNMCKLLSSAFSAGTILLTGLLDGHLLLMTAGTSPTVYLLPLGHVTPRSINLSGVVGEPLSTKWPHLTSSSLVKGTLARRPVPGAVTVPLTGATLLLLINANSGSTTGLATITFELKSSGKVSQALVSDIKTNPENILWISTTDPSTVYLMYIRPSFSVTILKKLTVSEGKDGKVTVGNPVMHYMCTNTTASKTVLFLEKIHSEGCHFFTLGAPMSSFRSFVGGKHIYIFGHDAVHTFDVEAIDKPGTAVPLSKHRYGTFFACRKALTTKWTFQGNSSIRHGHTSRSHAMIIVGISFVVILALVAAAVWFFVFSKLPKKLFGKNKKSKKRSKKESAKESKSKSETNLAANVAVNAGEQSAAKKDPAGSFSVKGKREDSFSQSRGKAKVAPKEGSSKAVGGDSLAGSKAAGESSATLPKPFSPSKKKSKRSVRAGAASPAGNPTAGGGGGSFATSGSFTRSRSRSKGKMPSKKRSKSKKASRGGKNASSSKRTLKMGMKRK